MMEVQDWVGETRYIRGNKIIEVKELDWWYYDIQRYPNGKYLVYTDGCKRAFHLDGGARLKRSKWLWY